ncbi:MAG: HDIG domain-containing protein [Saprospiraceae bacterium]
MNNSITFPTSQLKSIIRWVIVIGVIAFISLLFPDNARFPYEFAEGGTWRYETLDAPYDFPILKPESQLKKEIQALEEDFSPYYTLNTEILGQVKKQFREQFNQQLAQAKMENQFPNLQKAPANYEKYALSWLDQVYTKGIIDWAAQHQDKGDDFVINLVVGNTTQKRTAESLKTVEKVEQILTDSLPYSRLAEPEFLLYVMEDLIRPNIFFDDSLTTRYKRSVLSEVSLASGLVKEGDRIVTRGDVVGPETYQKLVSFKQQYQESSSESRKPLGIFLGYMLLTTLIVVAFLMYLQSYLPDTLQELKKLSLILMWLVIFSYLVHLVEQSSTLNAFMLPFCIVPIVVKTFFTDRLAFFTHIVVVLIASFLSSLGYEFTFLQIIAGIVAVLTTADTRNWTKFFMAMFFIFISYFLGFIGLSLIANGDLYEVQWDMAGFFFFNVLLTMLAFPLIPLLGRIFGFTTAISLVELSDMNRPLLQELALKAPGTLQHSLQVGNLAEAAARAIGADALLVKVGAYYHDVGKTLNPEYFIENQAGKNPHDDIDEKRSAEIIIGHVSGGAEMAKKARLPKVLIDFIKTHHGTTRTEYFFRNYVKNHPDELVHPQDFQYPGPKPKTREETILMMADSLEAAAKSLKNPNSEEIDDLVEKIINAKISTGQFTISEMSFKEFDACKVVFKKVLKSMLHVRIEYPEDTKKEQ